LSKITLEKSESVTLKRPKHEEEIGSKNMMPMCKSQKKTEVDNKKLGYEALTYAFQVGKSYINSRPVHVKSEDRHIIEQVAAANAWV